MPRKVWHKPLHQRKVWKQMSLMSKVIYYMHPFLEHLLDTWQQPLPFPTILKFVYSCILSVFILMPIIYPGAILLFIYGTFQYILERHFGVNFLRSLDLISYSRRVMEFEVTNEKINLFLTLYIERWRILGTAVASSIDYMRLVLCLLFGN